MGDEAEESIMSATTWGHHERGRNADKPSEIPAKGWKDTLLRIKKDVTDNRLSMIAAAMSYYALFAFVPTMSSIVLIYAWVSDPAEISDHLAAVSQFVPEDIMKIINDQLRNLASEAPTALGFSAISALAIALWSASKGSKAIIEALNIIYDETDERGFFKLNGLALGMTFLGAILGVLAIAVIVLVPVVMGLFNFGGMAEILATAASWLILLGLFSFFLAFAYRYGPHRQKAKWRWVSWGAVISSFLWALSSAAFSWYATSFGDFNKTYGSLGAIIVLMFWFYISSFVVLLGAEVDAELEHQTKRDSTTEPPKPLGDRGAKMADTVGESADGDAGEASDAGARTSTTPDRHQDLWH
jgi:membrane protein